ncbi:MAG: NAD(P)-binding protein [Bacilli bacterium]|nr:NAD(P)-binding protein [Bacilli bacterium]
MENYDTIIVGAGLAGCTLGYLLLKNNNNVLIIENQDLIKKHKLCGGIVTKKSYRLLFKIYGNNIEKINFKKYNTFKIKNNNIIKEVKKQILYTVYRKDLDDFVINEYIKSGGKILDKTNYDKIDFKNKIIYISGKSFKYNNLVGADGVFSRIRKDLTKKAQKMNFAIESECLTEFEIIQIDFLKRFKGYAWTISNNKTTLIGLGDVSKNKNIKDIFIDYFHLNKNDPIKGSFLPTGDDIILKRGSVFFIGDAAGLVSPVIGEGIYYALSSAYNLSKSMNNFYKVRMWKDRFIIFNHRVSKLLIYNTSIRNFFYKFYGKSKIISFLIDLVLKIFI